MERQRVGNGIRLVGKPRTRGSEGIAVKAGERLEEYITVNSGNNVSSRGDYRAFVFGGIYNIDTSSTEIFPGFEVSHS